MDSLLKERLLHAVEEEPFARRLGIVLREVDEGFARVEMTLECTGMGNIYGKAHGGAVFSLIDEAFEVAANSHGWIEVALNVNTTYVSAPEDGTTLTAVAEQVASTRRTATYQIRVTDGENRLIAVCQALAYRIDKAPPFAGTDPA